MIADEQVTTEPSSLFSAQDQAAIRAQLKKRLILVLIPVLALLGAAIYFAIQRNEVATDVLTIVSLSALIFCYDLFLKPLRCYQRHLDNVISGRRRAVDLPFLAISDDISLVDGVPYRAMTCTDLDAKGRPYDRLFYFDAEKPFPAIAAGGKRGAGFRGARPQRGKQAFPQNKRPQNSHRASGGRSPISAKKGAHPARRTIVTFSYICRK